jgi:hypothetical protein
VKAEGYDAEEGGTDEESFSNIAATAQTMREKEIEMKKLRDEILGMHVLHANLMTETKFLCAKPVNTLLFLLVILVIEIAFLTIYLFKHPGGGVGAVGSNASRVAPLILAGICLFVWRIFKRLLQTIASIGDEYELFLLDLHELGLAAKSRLASSSTGLATAMLTERESDSMRGGGGGGQYESARCLGQGSGGVVLREEIKTTGTRGVVLSEEIKAASPPTPKEKRGSIATKPRMSLARRIAVVSETLVEEMARDTNYALNLFAYFSESGVCRQHCFVLLGSKLTTDVCSYRVGVFINHCFCSFFFELLLGHFPENCFRKNAKFLAKRTSFW